MLNESSPAQPIRRYIGRLASWMAASGLVMALPLAFATADGAAMLCLGIALVSAIALLVRTVVNQGRRRAATFVAWAVYVGIAILLFTHYSFVRDHLRWLLLSGTYKARVASQPPPANGEFNHVEWDGWGFVGADTTVFLVFDPTDALAKSIGAPEPVRAKGLPCEVVRVRRLESQWYAVLFYTETYWGQAGCT